MAAPTFDTLLKGLKPGGRAAPNPVYYLHGEEDVLKEEAVRALLERAVDPAAPDFNVETRTAPGPAPEALAAPVGAGGGNAPGGGPQESGEARGAGAGAARQA